MTKPRKIALIILDGWGHGPDPKVSAIAQAETPFVDSLYNKYPHAELVTYGEEVGLPEGQMGNSEVGHLNIGAGRVVYQDFAKINKAVRDGSLAKNQTLTEALDYAKAEGKKVHLMGLVSEGGVHSHIKHLKALCSICGERGLKDVFVHAFMDGRDTDPKSGLGNIQDLSEHIKDLPVEISSVIGRYYAMDRDKRWERVKLAYDLLVSGTGIQAADLGAEIQAQYNNDVTDEFLPAIKNKEHSANISEGDVVLCFNFRTDRCREITEVLSQKSFPEYDMKPLNLRYLTMTRYDENFKNVGVLYSKEDLVNTLGEVLAANGKTQLRMAETEKYPHVTFFFSGGRELPFQGENRIVVPSPKVATYDLQPEMSAGELTEAAVKEIQANAPDFVCLNFANTDMVGHTGDFAAAKKAATFVDNCLKQVAGTALENDYDLMVIADHGNSDYMINADGSPHTAHTTNPVPLIFITNEAEKFEVKNGKLGDLAPSILNLMGLSIPKEMDGQVIIKSRS